MAQARLIFNLTHSSLALRGGVQYHSPHSHHPLTTSPNPNVKKVLIFFSFPFQTVPFLNLNPTQCGFGHKMASSGQAVISIQSHTV